MTPLEDLARRTLEPIVRHVFGEAARVETHDWLAGRPRQLVVVVFGRDAVHTFRAVVGPQLERLHSPAHSAVTTIYDQIAEYGRAHGRQTSLRHWPPDSTLT